jgi:segregation and condensation protein A
MSSSVPAEELAAQTASVAEPPAPDELVESLAEALPEDLPGDLPGDDDATGFQVHLDNFTGPFDLLLQLIGKHQMDVTEVALSRVTDEFIAHIRALGTAWELEEATEFLVVAATLLDLKAARLLPAAEVEDEEDLALLEARDLLFARLLQYKAYKEVAALFGRLEAAGQRRWGRAVKLEPRFAEMMPEVLLAIGPEAFALLAAKALAPKPTPMVSTEHVHSQRVSVREHAAIVSERLRRHGTSTFRNLCSDCESTLEVIARFLALLELYREGAVAFDQVQALGELHVRWTAGDDEVDVTVDEYAGTPAEVEAELPAEPEPEPDPEPQAETAPAVEIGTPEPEEQPT